jgi:hypothetical protein
MKIRDIHLFHQATGADVSLRMAVADSPWLRARGLMGRRAWDGWAGMVFVYPWPRRVALWMANTWLRLDAVFIASSGNIDRVAEGLVPHDKQPVSSGVRVKWVLELPAGRAAELGLRAGQVIVLKGLPPSWLDRLAALFFPQGRLTDRAK